MKSGLRKVKVEERSPAPKGVTKSVSMPPEFWKLIEARLATDPELDFSSYVRRLMRKDLAA